ncbi:RNA polymerase sigma factor [Guptibacillus algicola]|uniref:RNA polymerase sigma factor n=1 Tax=Guptibacillus algicola TaxID=225844 RepID=UPI001CD23675|nr:RNA polymerase sigma factor [Alkalihalobacillus algicola]MCA0989392.1 RNA polymerase sigma factor [Alkalihalobacillus algicola]
MKKENFAIGSWENEEQFQSFCDENKQALQSIARRIVNDQQIAEEVVQDVYLEVWNKRHQFDPNKGKLSSWVNQITKNRAIDRTKKEQRHFRETVIEDYHILNENSYTHDNIEDNHVIYMALTSLTNEQQEIVRLIYIEGYSQAEVATKKKIPLGTVKSRVRLGMKKLKETIGTPSLDFV